MAPLIRCHGRGRALLVLLIKEALEVSNFEQTWLRSGATKMRFDRNPRRRAMKRVIISMLLLGGFTALSTMEASAVVCARGVYRAGCVTTGGTAVVGRAAVVAPRGVAVRRGPLSAVDRVRRSNSGRLRCSPANGPPRSRSPSTSREHSREWTRVVGIRRVGVLPRATGRTTFQ